MAGRADDLGRLFEAGFMLGVVRALGTLPTPPPALSFYQAQRGSYNVPAVLDEFSKGLAGPADRAAAHLLARYYLLAGHLSGYGFLQEYLQALVAQEGAGPRRQEQLRAALAVPYWQCSLTGANRLAEEEDREATYQQWLDQAGVAAAPLLPQDRQTGGFLHADLLLLVHDPLQARQNILSVDVSVFTASAAARLPDLTRGSTLLHLLEADVLYLAEKGAFARLAIETGATTSPLFTPQLARYFNAFAAGDRESTKLIQAASYAAGFYRFAERAGLLRPAAPATLHIVGYTNRSVNSMVLDATQTDWLDACATIYPQSKARARTGPGPPGAGRQQVVKVIARNTARLFAESGDFVAALTDRLPAAAREAPSAFRAEHTEVLTAGQDFQNTDDPPPPEVLAHYNLTPADLAPHRRGGPPSLRAAHAALVWRALDAGRRYVFLTGNPGIGKTTAIADYLRQRCGEQGYLLLYISPRKAVNRDIFEKFRVGTEAGRPFYSPHLVGLTTNASLIADAGGVPTVELLNGRERLPTDRRGVQFWDSTEVAGRRTRRGRSGVTAVTDQTLRDRGTPSAGVLQTICTAIGAVLDPTRPNAVVATLAVQALKRNERGADTLDHLRAIFAGADNRRAGQFIPERMRALAATTRRLIIMIDEVTGDAAGYEFFRRTAELLDSFQLEQYGFQVTLVVADASITGIEVVRAHLNLRQREPDAGKVYLTLQPVPAGPVLDPLTLLPFAFCAPDDAYLVNSNSYPARHLHLRYKVHVQLKPLPADLSRPERQRLLSTWALEDTVNRDLVADVCALLDQPADGRPQALVYVQNKQRLGAIIGAIAQHQAAHGRSFVPSEDYLQIHADMAEQDRALAADEAVRDRFAVVFLTSSASRGLTFPRARHIFVDVPRFYVETNLMEIVQVIYRGRGGLSDQEEKTINFYLADHLLVPVGATAGQLQERSLDLVTMLALLKLCVMTRIRGGVALGERAVSLIPIGGKAVAGGGRAYHHDLARFARVLTRELRGARTHDPVLRRLQAVVQQLMGQVELQVPPSPGSYLALYRDLTPEQWESWLLSDAPVQEAYVLGSLLLVPLGGGETETAHHMSLDRAISLATDDETAQAIRTVLGVPERYAAGVYEGTRKLDQLIAELRAARRSQRLEQRSWLTTGYYVVPLAMFVAKGALAAYCAELAEQEGEGEGPALKQVLYDYVHHSYPIDTLLPIGWHYMGFPWLVITSQDLRALRAKTFRVGHTLMSREMNLLTMLLAYE